MGGTENRIKFKHENTGIVCKSLAVHDWMCRMDEECKRISGSIADLSGGPTRNKWKLTSAWGVTVGRIDLDAI